MSTFPLITTYAIDPRHVALRTDRRLTHEERTLLHRALSQYGKIRNANPFLVTRNRRLKHTLRELTHLGYFVEVQSPLIDPRTDAVPLVEMADDETSDEVAP